MVTFETVVVSRETFQEFINEVNKWGKEGWEPFQFDNTLPHEQGGTTLAMFMRRGTFVGEDNEPAAAAVAPPTNPMAIPDPSAQLGGAAPAPEQPAAAAPAAAAPAAAATAETDVQHPLVQAGIPPRLVQDVEVIAQIDPEFKTPKQIVMAAVMGWVRVRWEKLEQDGLVEIAPDGGYRPKR